MIAVTDSDFWLAAAMGIALVVTALLAYRSRTPQVPTTKHVYPGFTPQLPREAIELPVKHDDPHWRESVAISQLIADLIIAEEWHEIAEKIADWESQLSSTPGGTRYHDIAVETCLSGLQGLVDDAPRMTLPDLDQAQAEVAHFMESHRQSPNNHILALLAARAHIVLGDAFGAESWPEDVRRAAWRKMAQHYISAGNILTEFDPVAYMSPLLAEAHYLHAVGSPGGADRLPVLFTDWIDLDPANPDIYACHVAAMVANDAYSGDDVLQEASAALERTEDSLGFGGYALFFMPLLAEFDSARDLLDPEMYATALMDLASHSATQAEVNISAAALLTEIEHTDETTAEALRDSLMILIRKHLKEIYPRVWPVSVAEINELVQEAAALAPEIGPDMSSHFVSTRAERLAA